MEVSRWQEIIHQYFEDLFNIFGKNLFFVLDLYGLLAYSPFQITIPKGGGNYMAAQKKLLTKGQVVSHFAGKFEISKRAAASILDEYAALAIAETKKNGAFVLPGIGKSVLVKRKARMGRNPQTGKEIKIPAKTVVKIRPAKAFKEAIVPSKK
jgi:DNA-binding protein HU-beta